ncbi:hypothetical protein CYL18_10355 [Pradoshia eiseniae]|uniref:Uncharacterized protein n=1 Tax=Pradoshia eiseniae TaxID=2064768 RepID=A0A2S7MZM6_9BACI|nr:hypothetical protein CYL18_10355 [Pradoshia eiseniae]
MRTLLFRYTVSLLSVIVHLFMYLHIMGLGKRVFRLRVRRFMYILILEDFDFLLHFDKRGKNKCQQK